MAGGVSWGEIIKEESERLEEMAVSGHIWPYLPKSTMRVELVRKANRECEQNQYHYSKLCLIVFKQTLKSVWSLNSQQSVTPS